MGHFIKSNKLFNAFLDRLTTQNFNEMSEFEAEENLNEAPINGSSNELGGLKSDKLS